MLKNQTFMIMMKSKIYNKNITYLNILFAYKSIMSYNI